VVQGGVCPSRNGPGEPLSPMCTGTGWLLPGSLGQGCRSASVFPLQVLALLGGGAPLLLPERRQMRAMPCRDTPRPAQKDGVCHGGTWRHWWEWGLTVGDGASPEPAPSQAAAASSPPAPCTTPWQRLRLLLNLGEEHAPHRGAPRHVELLLAERFLIP